MGESFDIFISHASEDTAAVAAPLTAALERAGLRVWLDRDQLRLGDSVAGSINDALARARFTVVVISPAFLRKPWPGRELNASLDRLLPVLHGVTQEELQATAPLAGTLKSIAWTSGEAAVVAAILDRVRPDARRQATSTIAVDLAHGQGGERGWDDLEAAIDRHARGATKLMRGFFEDEAALAAARVLIMPPPRLYQLSVAETKRIADWVEAGGGLFLMGHYAERHHQMNVSALAWRFDLEFADDIVLPPTTMSRGHARSVDPRYSVAATPVPADHAIAAGVGTAAFISSASVRSTVQTPPEFTLETAADVVVARPLGRINAAGHREYLDDIVADRRGPVSLLAARRWKKGRVIAAGTWKLWTVEQGGNATMLKNALAWLAGET